MCWSIHATPAVRVEQESRLHGVQDARSCCSALRLLRLEKATAERQNEPTVPRAQHVDACRQNLIPMRHGGAFTQSGYGDFFSPNDHEDTLNYSFAMNPKSRHNDRETAFPSFGEGTNCKLATHSLSRGVAERGVVAADASGFWPPRA
jgi:hypothetical protein